MDNERNTYKQHPILSDKWNCNYCYDDWDGDDERPSSMALYPFPPYDVHCHAIDSVAVVRPFAAVVDVVESIAVHDDKDRMPPI